MARSIRQSLKYIKVPDGHFDLTYFPDFLIVGPQRTGTTWLHAHLRYHPQIMLAEPKELYFFSSLKTPQSPRFRSDELDWYLRFFREPLSRVLLRNAITLWRYRQLYRPKVRGEATASYAGLDRDVIREISILKPDVKAVLMIRNPVDRAWSHAKKDLARNRGRKLEDVPESEFERFFADPYQRSCGRYSENIDNWLAYLQPRHLMVAVFDDIDARPEALLLAVMSFLGVTSDRRYVSRDVRQAVNPTEESKIPGRYQALLEELLRDDIAKLKMRFGLSWSSPQSGATLERRRSSGTSDGRIVFALEK